MTPFDRVLDALREAGSMVVVKGQRAAARCPAHLDRHPSLSITYREGKVLLFCHAGCAATDVLAALDLDWSDLYDDPDVDVRPYSYRVKAKPSKAVLPPKFGIPPDPRRYPSLFDGGR